MRLRLVQELDRFREFLGVRMVISCGTQGIHSKNSLHYTGDAVDLVIPDRNGLSLLDCFVAATRFGFTGIGLYRDWEYNKTRVGGLHLEHSGLTHPTKYWLCTKQNGENNYLALTETNLFENGFIKG